MMMSRSNSRTFHDSLQPPPPVERIREICSCGAEFNGPANEIGERMVEGWREKHRHDKPRPELKSLGRPVHSDESTVTTGEVRESQQQDVPFGFFPPVVEAQRGER